VVAERSGRFSQQVVKFSERIRYMIKEEEGLAKAAALKTGRPVAQSVMLNEDI
jgi:hypothetical protein